MSAPRKSGPQAAMTPVILAVTVALASCGQRTKTAFDAPSLAARVVQLEARVAYLDDRQQIHDVYLRYMRGFDRNDVELMRSAFWPDVQINYGTQSNTFDEFVVRHLNEHTKQFAHYAHLITNESVDIAGDVAHVEAYVTRLSNFKKGGKAMIISGRYVDRLDRRNGEWRIAVREFVPHFMIETNSVIDSYFKVGTWPQTDCAEGTWDRRDPSYRRPLLSRSINEVGPACTEQTGR